MKRVLGYAGAIAAILAAFLWLGVHQSVRGSQAQGFIGGGFVPSTGNNSGRIVGPWFFSSEQSYSTTGTSSDIALSASASVFRYQGAGTATFTGFASPSVGRTVIVRNESAFNLTASNNVTSTAANRLSTPTSVDWTCLPGGSWTQMYVAGSTNRWLVFPGSACFEAPSTTAMSVSGTINALDSGGKKVLLLDCTGGACTINGIVNGTPGKPLRICNESGSNPITLSTDSASAAVGDKLTMLSSVSQTLNTAGTTATSCADLFYDGVTAHWRLVNMASRDIAVSSIAMIGSFSIALTGHMRAIGTAPAPSSCGASPAVIGADPAFRVTTGTGGTTCTITFAAAYTTNAPVCTVWPEGTTTLPTCTISTSAITCTTTIASTKYHWLCWAPN